MFKRITSARILKYSVVVMLLQCSVSNYGMEKEYDDDKKQNDITENNYHNFNRMITKLVGRPIWTKQLKYGELCWGINNGLCWYPPKLNFEDKDFKIGFFFFGLRIFSLVDFLYLKVFNVNNFWKQEVLRNSYFCYILSFKLKYWYINFFDLNMSQIKMIRHSPGSSKLFAFISWLSPAICVDMSRIF